MSLSDLTAKQARATLARAIAVQQIAAPTFAEEERAAFVARELRTPIPQAGGRVEIVGGSDVPVNVLATLPGLATGAPLLISAHTDTVFPAGTDLRVAGGPDSARIAGPGIGDNSLAVASLVAVAESLAATAVRNGPVVLLANAGEEGRGDLRGMNAALDLLAERGQSPGAAIVLEGMALGRIYSAGIGVKRYEISVCGPGGHSWGDAGTPSAIHELVAFLSRLAAIRPAADPRSTLNVGVVSGGRSVNTIADAAWAELDLRSETAAGLAYLDNEVRELVGSWRLPPGLQRDLTVIGERPAGAMEQRHPLVQAALASYSDVGGRLQSGSTDANALLARGIPAVCVGITTGGNAHRLDEYIDTAPVEDGLRSLGMLIERASGLLASVGDPEGDKR
jgi:acetylornithine deacetylase/succinyl-diaminopimelate desuccinylase-like protein